MVASFAYDAASRRTSRTLGDTPGTQTAWVYGRQDNLPTAIGSDIAGASFTYTYDANKNKLTEGISAPMANFGFNSTAYDQADRLTAWNRTDGNLDQAWNLSLVGNWATFTENQLQQTRSHTAVHEIAAIDANPIAHDATGNLIRNPGDTIDRYTWDFDNRLATADVDQDGTLDCLYRYDALGQRVSKTVPDGESSATTVFVGTIQELEYSPHAMQVVAEYAADAVPASPERKFVYAEYIDEPVMMVFCETPTEAQYYYHQNSLYSVAAITDATATVVERYAYSAYGKPLFLDASANLLAPQASTVSNPYLFTGRRLDPETGLYYYRARMYDSKLGRFVSRDPIGYDAGDVSLYQYVAASPLDWSDPEGLIGGHCSKSAEIKFILRSDSNWRYVSGGGGWPKAKFTVQAGSPDGCAFNMHGYSQDIQTRIFCQVSAITIKTDTFQVRDDSCVDNGCRKDCYRLHAEVTWDCALKLYFVIGHRAVHTADFDCMVCADCSGYCRVYGSSSSWDWTYSTKETTTP